MTKSKELVVPREKAVFRLDGNGRWHNEHGEFGHRKIIEHFHASIQRDEGGYFVGQSHGEVLEKVYFPYEDTAVFVFEVIRGEPVMLVLNTRRQVPLIPEKLFVREDALFMSLEDEIIKFTDKSLLHLSPMLENIDDRLHIVVEGKHYSIPDKT